MNELARILRYLLHRVPMSSQAEHDAIALLIDGLEAIPVSNQAERAAIAMVVDGLEAANGQTETNGGTQP